MIIEKPGSYRLTMEEHHCDPCCEPSISRSIIKMLISGCPAHAYYSHPKFNPNCGDNSTDAMKFGTVCHSLFLEGVDVAERIDPEDYPGKKGGIPIGWTNDAIRSARDSAIDRGKIPLLSEDYDKAVTMVESAHRQLAESELGIKCLAEEGDSELSYFWKDREGVWGRVRPDWLSKDRVIMLDYKTTAQMADPSAYSRNILATGIDIQGALYPRGVKSVDGVEPKFIIMVQELSPPHLCSFISLSPQFIELGKSKMREGMSIWRECLASGEWAGYPKRICYLDMPAWAQTQWEERRLQVQTMEDPTASWGDE